jgi:hypothetical protein
MAINTGSLASAAPEQVYAKAPDFPSNLGKLDVGAIYDAVKAGAAVPQDMVSAARSGAIANALAKPQTQEAQAQAQAGTAGAELQSTRANFLAGLNPYARENVLAGRVPGSKVTKTTYDPGTQSILSTETTEVPGATRGSAPQPFETSTNSTFSPRQIETFREHTDTNGNIVTNTGTWRVLDATKPAFSFNEKTGEITPILGPDGNPVNATLVGSAGTAVRGTFPGSGVGGDAAHIANLQEAITEHPDLAPTLQPLIDQIKAGITGQNAKLGAQTDALKGTNAKPGTPEWDQAKIDDLTAEIGRATLAGNTALAAQLTGTVKAYQDIQKARTEGLTTKLSGKVGGGSDLSNYVPPANPGGQPGVTPVAPAAKPAGPTLAPTDKAAYDALPPGSAYYVSGNPNVFFKGNATPPPAAAAAAPANPTPDQSGGPQGQ